MLGKLMLCAAGVGGLYMAMAGTTSKEVTPFAQSADTALARLRAERRIVLGTGMGSLELAYAGTEEHAMLLSVQRAGDTGKVTCRVIVRPVAAARSRAWVGCVQRSFGDEAVRAVGTKAVELVAAEHVRATVNDQPYDIDGVSDRLMTLLLLNRATIASSIADDS